MNIDLTLEEDLVAEELPESTALSTYSTASSATTASCPISSAGSIMTANCSS
ncbi:MAG: thiocillin family RiPP [Actinomycetaceae bacterium]